MILSSLQMIDVGLKLRQYIWSIRLHQKRTSVIRLSTNFLHQAQGPVAESLLMLVGSTVQSG